MPSVIVLFTYGYNPKSCLKEKDPQLISVSHLIHPIYKAERGSPREDRSFQWVKEPFQQFNFFSSFFSFLAYMSWELNWVFWLPVIRCLFVRVTVCLWPFHIFSFSSRISNKLGTKYPWLKLYKFVQIRKFIDKIFKSSSPKPLG